MARLSLECHTIPWSKRIGRERRRAQECRRHENDELHDHGLTLHTTKLKQLRYDTVKQTRTRLTSCMSSYVTLRHFENRLFRLDAILLLQPLSVGSR